MMPVSFDGRLERGAFWEAWVGAVLSRCGLHTVHYPCLVDKTKNFDNTWDLEVFYQPSPLINQKLEVRSLSEPNDGRSSGSGRTAVEVKSNKLTYHGVDDYPFDTVLVCAQDSWMKKWPGKETVQRDFLMVSRLTGHLVWVPTGTKVQLNHPVHDRNRNYSYKCVVVNKDQLRPFAEFITHVKAQES